MIVMTFVNFYEIHSPWGSVYFSFLESCDLASSVVTDYLLLFSDAISLFGAFLYLSLWCAHVCLVYEYVNVSTSVWVRKKKPSDFLMKQGVWATQRGCWEIDSSPLQEKFIFLHTESFLHCSSIILIKITSQHSRPRYQFHIQKHGLLGACF